MKRLIPDYLWRRIVTSKEIHSRFLKSFVQIFDKVATTLVRRSVRLLTAPPLQELESNMVMWKHILATVLLEIRKMDW